MRRHIEHHQVVVGEPTGIDGGHGHLAPHADQNIGQVDFAREERGMICARQPLAERHDMFKADLVRRRSKDRVEVKTVRRGWCALIGSLDARHGPAHVAQRVLIADKNLGTGLLQHVRTVVVAAHERPDGIAVPPQLKRGRQAGLAACAGDQDLGFDGHGTSPF